jgi:hypothetical protein
VEIVIAFDIFFAVPCRIGQLNGVRSPLNGLKSLSPLQYGAWWESSGAVATVQLSPPTNKIPAKPYYSLIRNKIRPVLFI